MAGEKIDFYLAESSRAEVEKLIVEKSGAEVLTAVALLEPSNASTSSLG